jgi:hypothetical protein
MEEHGKKLRRRRRCGKREVDGEAWLSDDPHEVEASYEEDWEQTETRNTEFPGKK